ncbi:MAG: DNA polymerase IV [Solirubrobacteraceae bacterium]
MFVHHSKPTILHADLDSFYASVEQRDNPALRGRPVIVGGGVVLAASYEAKARGIRTAMGGHVARRLCPEAVVVPPRMTAYAEASKDVFAIFERTSPLVEALSIDEAFLDVRGLEHISGTPTQIAKRLRAEVRDELGLPITVGLACTKFLAKVASGVAKPDGLLVIPAGAELGFLHPLPVERLWGVGRVTSARLHEHGIRTVRQAAAADEQALMELLGRAAGRQVHALANNRDPRPVRSRKRRGSIGAQRALGKRVKAPAEVQATLMTLIDRVARRLRAARRACRTVVLRLRFDDFSRATRSHTMTQATTRTAALLRVARGLLTSAQPMIFLRGLTLIGVALTNLCDEHAIQLALPFDRVAELDRVIDTLRERYGSSAVLRGALVGRDAGPWVPLLPD